jgi:hypothetical protein
VGDVMANLATTPNGREGRFEAPKTAGHTFDMLSGMATTNRVLKRLITVANQLEPEDRATLVRAILGDDGLMGAIEAADELGVKQPNLRPIPGLPTAIQTLRCGSIWLADEVQPFAAQRRSRAA